MYSELATEHGSMRRSATLACPILLHSDVFRRFWPGYRHAALAGAGTLVTADTRGMCCAEASRVMREMGPVSCVRQSFSLPAHIRDAAGPRPHGCPPFTGLHAVHRGGTRCFRGAVAYYRCQSPTAIVQTHGGGWAADGAGTRHAHSIWSV